MICILCDMTGKILFQTAPLPPKYTFKNFENLFFPLHVTQQWILCRYFNTSFYFMLMVLYFTYQGTQLNILKVRMFLIPFYSHSSDLSQCPFIPRLHLFLFESQWFCTYSCSFVRQCSECNGRHSGTQHQQVWRGKGGHSCHCFVSTHWYPPDGRSGTPGCPASAPAGPEDTVILKW